MLTAFQFEVGQVLIITKRHVSTLMDVTSEEAAAVIDGHKVHVRCR